MTTITTRPNPYPNAHTLLLSTTALSTSRHFAPLIDLINTAFSHAHTTGIPGKELFSASVRRITKAQDLLDDLGPNSFCYIMFEEEEGEDSEMIGTISAKPFTETKAASEDSSGRPISLFKRPPPPPKQDDLSQAVAPAAIDDPESSKWELMALAVAVKVKGKGVASILIEQCISEIRHRAAEEYRQKGCYKERTGSRKVVLYLSAMQELNEAYYIKKGWRTTSLRRYGKGTAGSKVGFGVVDMVREVDVDIV